MITKTCYQTEDGCIFLQYADAKKRHESELNDKFIDGISGVREIKELRSVIPH